MTEQTSSTQEARSPRDEIRLVQFNRTYEGYGMIMDYLSRRGPFSGFPAGVLAEAISQQLEFTHHLVALRRDKVVGYAGWLLTTPEIAEAWVAGRGKLLRRHGDEAQAAALTIVASEERAAVTRLIRGARELNPGRRAYFKRGADGQKPARKLSLPA